MLIADNGSIGGSGEIPMAHGAEMVPVPERGYGAATVHGLRVAEVPTTLLPAGRSCPPQRRHWRDAPLP